MEYSSQRVLRQKFPGCSHGYPVYEGRFKNMAVLVFATPEDGNAKGYELADARLRENEAQLKAK